MDVENVESSISPSTNKRGGFRACMFVLVFTSMENIGFVTNISSLVLYFHLVMQFDLSSSANTLTNFMGSTYLLTILGGFISDTYLNRLFVCLIFGSLQLTGMFLLFIQAYSQKLQPDPCTKSSCLKGGQSVVFYSSLVLMALGSGCVKGSIVALGADQFDQKDGKEAKDLASFFNSLQFSITIGSAIAVTAVIWVAMNKGWHWGFLISLITSFIGFVILAMGKPFYRLQPPGTSPLVKIAEVIIVAIRNRNVPAPQNSTELYETEYKDAIAHSSQFRFLDKAATVRQGVEVDPLPWRICTVTQVEEVKILIRMLPIIFSTIILNTCMAQLQTYSVLQGYSMNTLLGSFKIPSASIPAIPLFFMAVLIPVYEFFFVPFARKFTGHPTGITLLQRVGVSLVLSFTSMAAAGVVEVKRRHQALKTPLKPISLFWLSFQYCIFGVAELFAVVGLMEFFYRQAPKWMRSLSTSFALLSLSFGYFLSTIFVNVLNSVTKKVTPSKQGWLEAPDLNHNKLELFYWFLAILSFLNFLNYLFWASWYKYKTDTKVAEAQAATARGSSIFVAGD